MILSTGRGWVGFFVGEVEGLDGLRGRAHPASGDKHIFNGWRGGGDIIFVITVNHVAVLIRL